MSLPSSSSLLSADVAYSAWSWIPFTHKKARQIQNDPKGQAKEGKENAKGVARSGEMKGEEVAEVSCLRLQTGFR